MNNEHLQVTISTYLIDDEPLIYQAEDETELSIFRYSIGQYIDMFKKEYEKTRGRKQ